MAKAADHTETLAERIAFLMKHSQGTMPIGMIVADEAEAAEAQKLLAASRNKAAKLIVVTLQKDRKEWKRHTPATEISTSESEPSLSNLESTTSTTPSSPRSASAKSPVTRRKR